MKPKIKDVVQYLTTPEITMESTVDRYESGDPEQEVTGIASVFLATQEILEEAMKLGVNLVISHEGIYFSHWDKQRELAENRVFRQKRKMILDSGIAVYRYHDYIHRQLPDSITAGLLRSLDWQAFEKENRAAESIVELPDMTLLDVILHVKKHLAVDYIRFAGDISMPCKRVGVAVGYRGSGDTSIPFCDGEDIDLLIYGEGPEWETPEYIRDAMRQGRKKALLVLGHAESEAPGMELLADRLKAAFPGVPVHFIPQKPVFRVF